MSSQTFGLQFEEGSLLLSSKEEKPRSRYFRVRKESDCEHRYVEDRAIPRVSKLTATELRDYLKAEPFFDHASLTAEAWPIYKKLRTAVRTWNDKRCASDRDEPMYHGSCPDLLKDDLGQYWRPRVLKDTGLTDWPWAKRMTGSGDRDVERETTLRNGLVYESCMWGVIKWVAEREGIDASAGSDFWADDDPTV